MSLFRRTTGVQTDPAQLVRDLEQCRGNTQYYLQTMNGLLYALKEFSFDIAEIKAEEFKKRIDEFGKKLASGDDIRPISDRFAHDKEYILAFIAKEKDYLRDREGELRNIIELLTKGLEALTGANEQFNAHIYEGNLRLERMLNLEDLRKIKESLKVEVEQMKTAIKEKQEKDAQQREHLASHVKGLQVDLAKAQHASMTDGLTGAFNRLALDQHLNRLVERCGMSWEPFSLLLCDIDDFKRINDQLGHQVGDRVLMALVQHCKSLVRKDDMVARYGGEEFVIILPGASLRQAVKKAKTLCAIVAQARYIIDNERPDEKLGFTASIGVSLLRRTDTAQAVVERADKAMYHAKKGGKNRVASERDSR